jgi:hypothetical protein
MIAYYIVRDVVRGASCSYPCGRTLCNSVAGFRFSEDAQRVADSWNRACGVAGVAYLVMAHEETEEFPCDQLEK